MWPDVDAPPLTQNGDSRSWNFDPSGTSVNHALPSDHTHFSSSSSQWGFPDSSPSLFNSEDLTPACAHVIQTLVRHYQLWHGEGKLPPDESAPLPDGIDDNVDNDDNEKRNHQNHDGGEAVELALHKKANKRKRKCHRIILEHNA